MGLKDKLKRFRFPHLRKKEAVNVPEQWVKNKTKKIIVPKTGKDMITLEAVRHKKFHVPGLRLANQLLAVFCIAANFFISQAALMSMTPEIAALFLINSYIALWGLWKSRREREKLEL